jgi:hypothetical protein
MDFRWRERWRESSALSPQMDRASMPTVESHPVTAKGSPWIAEVRRHPWGPCLIVLSSLLLLPACEQAPAEPPASDAGRRPTQGAEPLTWTTPPTWNVERVAQRGLYRAKYTVPTAGNAKLTAEVLVTKIDANEKANLPRAIADVLRLFESPDGQKPTREQFQVRDFSIMWAEIEGTYRFPMGPPVGPQKQAAAHVLKKDWRGIVVGVKTKSRGRWLFRLVGPEDSVAAARSTFRSMIESLK